MVEYEGKGTQKYEDKINVFHYNDKTGMYKVLAVNPFKSDKTGKEESMFFSIRTGVKGGNKENLSLLLNKNEVAYLIMELTKYYNKLD